MITNKLFGLHMTMQNSALDEKHPHICIGWSSFGDLTDAKTKEDIEKIAEVVQKGNSRNSISQNVSQINRFRNETSIDDYVIYRENKKIHIGRVTSDWYKKTDFENQDKDYINNRDVEWIAHYPTSILSEKASNSLGSAMSYFSMDSYKEEISKLIDGSYLNELEIYKKLKDEKEIDPYTYDGSFTLLKEIANAYQDVEIDSLDYHDLELFYFSVVGTWKRSFADKRDKVSSSNLSQDKKQHLLSLIDELEAKTNNGEFTNSELQDKKTMGLFGTGIGTLRNVSDEDARLLLDVFLKVAATESEDECIKHAKEVLIKSIKGVKTGVLSPILYCLKPTVFPIINGNQGAGTELFEKLGIIIEEPLEIYTYPDNAYRIKQFRDKYFEFKNYRVFDLASSLLKKTVDNVITGSTNEQGIFTCETGLTKEDWIDILKDKNLIDEECIKILKFWYSKNNYESCCKEAGDVLYKDQENSTAKINGKITGRCQKICTKYEITINDEGENRYFPVMMNGRYSTYENSKVYNWILKPEVVEALEGLGLVDVENKPDDKNYDTYSKADFLEEVFLDEDKYDQLRNLLKRKKNIIIQGTPGVGKTFMAKRLAYSIIGKKNPNRIETIQFHQSYSYEDFIFGYQPTPTSFELKPGIFYNFCKKAEKDIENPYFFIIDEINRGNLSKIFGELLMLIEEDKRGQSLTLSHTKEKFSVPENVYIIGMMNTADRSLAIIDYALRRRFSFVQIEPAFSHPGFKKHLLDGGCSLELAEKIIISFNKLNDEIKNDSSLGEGFMIGHSYFCKKNPKDNSWVLNEETYKDIINFEIKPILDEYWFDDKKKANQKIDELLK